MPAFSDYSVTTLHDLVTRPPHTRTRKSAGRALGSPLSEHHWWLCQEGKQTGETKAHCTRSTLRGGSSTPRDFRTCGSFSTIMPLAT